MEPTPPTCPICAAAMTLQKSSTTSGLCSRTWRCPSAKHEQWSETCEPSEDVEPMGGWIDQSGNGRHLLQDTLGFRPFRAPRDGTITHVQLTGIVELPRLTSGWAQSARRGSTGYIIRDGDGNLITLPHTFEAGEMISVAQADSPSIDYPKTVLLDP